MRLDKADPSQGCKCGKQLYLYVFIPCAHDCWNGIQTENAREREEEGDKERERETETCVHRHVYENVYVYDCVCMYVKVCTVYAYELMGICICYRMRNVFVHIYTLHIPFIVHVNMIGS